jgi:DNA polymerase-4
MGPNDRWIIHLDLDAFYASVEVLDDPSLKGRPVIVGGLGPRGVVSTCSYEARAQQVRSGMPTARARRLCPDGVFLGVRMARYREVSDVVMAIFRRYTPLVEPLSLDEAFLDVTGSLALFGPAEAMAASIRSEVKAATGLTISAGVASNKHVAKVASGLRKPDALTVVPRGGEREFLAPLGLGKIWGVGEVTAKTLKAMGLVTIADVAAMDPAAMITRLGDTGRRVWELANGLDPRAVEPERPIKSLGAEETYAEDIDGREAISRELLALCVKVAGRLRERGLEALTVTLKARDGRFKTVTRSRTTRSPHQDHLRLHRDCLELFPMELPGPWRLLGVQASNLVEAGRGRPASLLSALAPAKPMVDPRLDQAMDAINRRFGALRLAPATLLERRGRKPGPYGPDDGGEGDDDG